MRKHKFYIIAFIFLLVLYNKFFEFKPLQEFSNQLLVVVYILLFIFIFRQFSFTKGLFIAPIRYIIFSIILGIIPSVLFWNQSLFECIIGIAPFSYFLLFLFLIQAKIKQEVIIKIILGNAYLGLLLFIYQTINANTVIFGYVEEFKLDRGIVRIVFPGEGFMFFALFYYLNKLGRRFEIKYVIAVILFMIMMLAQVTRMYILAFGLIATYHFLIKAKLSYRLLGIGLFIAGYLFFYNSDNTIVAGIRDANESDAEIADDYIRLLSAEHYLFKFPKNDLSYVLGNGSYNFSSTYGKTILGLNENESFYLEDLGLLKGYVLFGILFVFGYLIIFIRSFTAAVPYNKYYLKYYLWMILILSFTTRANAHAGFGAVMVTVLYLFEYANIEKNNVVQTKRDLVTKIAALKSRKLFKNSVINKFKYD